MTSSLWKALVVPALESFGGEEIPEAPSIVINKTLARSSGSWFLQATNRAWTDRFVDSVGSTGMGKRKERAANREFAVDLSVPV